MTVKEADRDSLLVLSHKGLATDVNPLLLTEDFSPSLMNVDVLPSGAVAKRKGMRRDRAMGLDTTSYTGDIIKVIKTKLGKRLTLNKTFAGNLAIYGDESTFLQTKAGVFPSDGIFERGKPDVAVLNENDRIRVIFTQNSTVPVQLTIAELRISVTHGGGGTITINGAPDVFWNCTTSTPSTVPFFWYDDTRVGVNSSSFNSSTKALTLTLASSVAAGVYTVDVIWFTWQWWCEALCLDGNHLFGSSLQGPNDLTVSIPEKLTRDIFPVNLSSISVPAVNRYPIVPWSSIGTASLSTFALVNNQAPTGATEFCFSTAYVPASSVSALATKDFIRTGTTPGTAREIFFSRGYNHRFKCTNSQMKCAGEDMYVFLRFDPNNKRVGQSVVATTLGHGGAGTPAPAGSTRHGFQICEGVGSIVQSSVATAEAVIFLDGAPATNLGVGLDPKEQFIILGADAAPLRNKYFLGADALGPADVGFDFTTYEHYEKDGHPYPAFGFQDFADYSLGYFPATVCLYQDRLVFAGFPHNPTQVVFSGVGDTWCPGYFYNNFQVFIGDGSDFEPLDIRTMGGTAELITAVREFQSQLFVFTRNKIFRVSGGDSPVTPSRAYAGSIASVGAVNPQAVQDAGASMYFVSKAGMYELVPTDTPGGYTTNELSVLIRDKFLLDQSRLEKYAWMMYDSDRNKVYVALPGTQDVETAEVLYIYGERTKSWAQWSFGNAGPFHTIGGSFVTGEYPRIAMVTGQSVTRAHVIETEIDGQFYDEWSTEVASGANSAPIFCYSTTGSSLTEYAYDVGASGDFRKLETCPLDLIDDLYLTIDGALATYGTDYTKTPHNTVNLATAPGAVTLAFYPGTTIDGTKYLGNLVMYDNSSGTYVDRADFSVTANTDDWSISDYTIDTTANVGLSYPTWIATPVFYRNSAIALDAVKEFVGLYWNKYLGTYTSSLERGDGIEANFDLAVYFPEDRAGDYYPDYPKYWQQENAVYDLLDDVSRVDLSLHGSGYGFQIYHYSNDKNAWCLLGYELITATRPTKATVRSQA